MASTIRLAIPLFVYMLFICLLEQGNFRSCSTRSTVVHAFTTTVTTTTPTAVVIMHRRPSTLTIQLPVVQQRHHTQIVLYATTDDDSTLKTSLKEELLILLGGKGVSLYDDDHNNDDDDAVVAEIMEDVLYVDPITKLPLRKRILPSKQLIVGGAARSSGSGGGAIMSQQERTVRYEYMTTSSTTTTATTAKYVGSSDTYINLLEPYNEEDTNKKDVSVQETISRALLPFVPIPFRSTMVNKNESKRTDDTSTATTNTQQYIPMRDLFTSPTVSYLYERGWRQGFAQAGFPGVDTESIMAYDYLQPALIGTSSSSSSSSSNGILVDMSCATGLFTRKFLRRALLEKKNNIASSETTTKPNIIRRLIGADYSDAMLREARQRINNDVTIQELLYNYTTAAAKSDHKVNSDDFTFELVRLDVGKLPMRNGSIDALHAGAAMHCWPDIDQALSEIYRVLRPNGGRYFATTFLANYFRSTQTLLNINNQQRQRIQDQAFQYFSSPDELRSLLVKAGFSNELIQIDVVGPSCVIIRCEK